MKKIVLVLLISLFVLLSFKKIYTSDTLVPNLEPYPDGLLYAIKALKMVRPDLIAHNFSTSDWDQPLYSWFLSIGYLFNSNPGTFYLINILLGGINILLLFLILNKTVKKVSSIILGLVLFKFDVQVRCLTI